MADDYWPAGLLHIIHMYIATMTELETRGLKTGTLDRETEEFLIGEFETLVLNHSISIDQLRQKFGYGMQQTVPIGDHEARSKIALQIMGDNQGLKFLQPQFLAP